MSVDNVGLILARGGSKGIKNKNLVNINGRPLIYYAINALKNSSLDEVFLSTNCKKIKKVATSLNVEVIDRPDNLAQDTSSSEDSLLHFSKIHDYNNIVFVQPTSPLIKSTYIDEAIKKLKNDNLDSIFSVTKSHWIPTWSLNSNPINWNIKNRPRRQDKPEFYVENGMFYITSKYLLEKNKNRYSGKIGFYEIPLCDSFQIDSYEDLDLVRKIM